MTMLLECLHYFRYLKDYTERFDLKVQYNTKVVKIRRGEAKEGKAQGFRVELSTGDILECDVVLMATGAMKEIIPDIPGKELAKAYSEHSINQEDYTNRTVCVVGGGNSGFEVRY